VSNRHPWPILDFSDLLARSGRRREAETLVDEILDRSSSQYVSPQAVGAALWNIGRGAEAAAWLERAYRERDTSLPSYTNWPFLSSFAEDSTIADIHRRLGLSRAAINR